MYLIEQAVETAVWIYLNLAFSLRDMCRSIYLARSDR